MTDFLLRLGATTLGVLLAFALNYALQWWNRRQEQSRERARRVDYLIAVSQAVYENQTLLEMLKRATEAGDSMPIVPFNLSSWRSVEGHVASSLGDADLFGRLARYFSRLEALARIAERYSELASPEGDGPRISKASAKVNRELILDHVRRLEKSSSHLIQWLTEVRAKNVPVRRQRPLKPVEHL